MTTTPVAGTLPPEGASMGAMPNQPKTPVTTFRIPPELKKAATAKAQAEDRTLTDVVLKALERYVKTK